MSVAEIIILICLTILCAGMIGVICVMAGDPDYHKKIEFRLVHADGNPCQKRRGYHIAKRLFDVLLSIVGIVSFLPIMIIVWIILRISNKNRAIMWVQCTGPKKKIIKYYRFNCRKMDGSFSSAGRIIYSMCLDSIPMFFSVLKGDLSLIGLSRTLLSADDKYIWMYEYEKPGLVSVSAVLPVNGKNIFEKDEMYLKTRGILFDFRMFGYIVSHVLTKTVDE